MKELTLQEVLQVAGGLPDRATLDELSYRDGVPAPGTGQPPTHVAPSPPNEA
jgi:hypothetical protein